MPSVSVVLLTRNRPRHLLEALGCVAAQTHAELELVLVRDGGEPLSAEARAIMEGLEFPVLLVEREGSAAGVARSRNEAIGKARADCFALLDDDDRWTPDHVARLAAALEEDERIDVAYSDARLVREDDGEERVIGRDFELGIFRKDDYLPPSTLLLRRSAFERVGPFDESFSCSEDWDWLLRVAKDGGVIRRVPGASATVLIHAGAHSALQLDRLEERTRCLALLRERHRLPPLEPKTYWEVAETVCPGNATTS